MSGKIDVCTECGGEIHTHPYEAGKYIFGGAWCFNCNRAVVIIPEKAYDDDDYDIESYSVEVASRIRKFYFREPCIIDGPDFQFKHTNKPDDTHNCSSCKNEYAVVWGGDYKGYGCRKHTDIKPRFDGFLKKDCKDYLPLEEWYGMGLECRCCLHNCQQVCNIKGDLKDVSAYDRGHCNDYVYSTIWGFERKSVVLCPKCFSLSSVKKNGKWKCENCGSSSDNSPLTMGQLTDLLSDDKKVEE